MNDEKFPGWYTRALETDTEQSTVSVEGCKINYATWGKVGNPGIVLIHGSNANLEWWRFVAPFLSDQFRVAAIDLSGNGDSDWRDIYSGELYAREVMAVCEAAELGPRPQVVAHSFGGFVGLETGHHYGLQLGGIIFCDFTVRPPEQYTEWGKKAAETGTTRPTRIYESFEAALGRFRLVPEQPCPAFVVDYLGRKALRQVEGGWTWKFDPAMFDHLEMGMAQRDKFARLACRSALILGEHSTDDGALSGPYMAEITRGILPAFTLPGTHHHFMLDEPIATVAAIKGILLAWLREDRVDEMHETLAELVGD